MHRAPARAPASARSLDCPRPARRAAPAAEHARRRRPRGPLQDPRSTSRSTCTSSSWPARVARLPPCGGGGGGHRSTSGAVTPRVRRRAGRPVGAVRSRPAAPGSTASPAGSGRVVTSGPWSGWVRHLVPRAAGSTAVAPARAGTRSGRSVLAGRWATTRAVWRTASGAAALARAGTCPVHGRLPGPRALTGTRRTGPCGRRRRGGQRPDGERERGQGGDLCDDERRGGAAGAAGCGAAGVVVTVGCWTCSRGRGWWSGRGCCPVAGAPRSGVLLAVRCQAGSARRGANQGRTVSRPTPRRGRRCVAQIGASTSSRPAAAARRAARLRPPCRRPS